MLVLRVALLAALGACQKRILSNSIMLFDLLVSRAPLGASLLLFIYHAAFFSWNSYFTSYMQVVYHASISQSGSTGSIFEAIYSFVFVLSGWSIRCARRFRWLLYLAVPLYILGQRLFIYFRIEGTGFGYIVMCQIFIAIAGATVTLTVCVAVLAAVMSVFDSVSTSFGDAISAVVWTRLFPRALIRLPSELATD